MKKKYPIFLSFLLCLIGIAAAFCFRGGATAENANTLYKVLFALSVILAVSGLVAGIVNLLPERKPTSIRTLAMASIFAALCYVGFAFFQIKISVGDSSTSFHLGNVFCVMAALLLGGFWGGMAGAIGMTLAELYGGTPSIATLAIVITGILGNMFGTYFCKWFGITQEIAQGVAFGTSSHVIGTAKANELSVLAGAVSSVSLVVSGLLTAIVFPVLTSFL